MAKVIFSSLNKVIIAEFTTNEKMDLRRISMSEIEEKRIVVSGKST